MAHRSRRQPHHGIQLGLHCRHFLEDYPGFVNRRGVVGVESIQIRKQSAERVVALHAREEFGFAPPDAPGLRNA